MVVNEKHSGTQASGNWIYLHTSEAKSTVMSSKNMEQELNNLIKFCYNRAFYKFLKYTVEKISKPRWWHVDIALCWSGYINIFYINIRE